MGRRNMNDLRTFARFIALAALVFWCVVSVSAAPQKPVPTSPKPAPVLHKTAPPQHKLIRPTAGAAHAHAIVHPARKPIATKPMHRQVPERPILAKKPVETPKPAPGAVVPAVPSAAALADQTPALSETGHGRDPFAALIRPTDPNAGHENLPPGIAGLQVATLRIQGMVRTADGMVAVVSNPQDSVYFIHDGDHIFDGVVEKIGIDDVTFRQESKDAFGRTIDRDVAKRLYPIAGDEQ